MTIPIANDDLTPAPPFRPHLPGWRLLLLAAG